MRIKTFKNIAKRLPVDISVLIRGPHGIGKSRIVYDIAKELGLEVIERRLSELTEGDLIGLPFKVEKNDKAYSTTFLPMDWFCEAMEKPYLIFLDEWDRAQLEVLQSTFELVLDRSIQGKKIHKDCRIIAAINGGEHSSVYSVTQLDPALLDRVWICDLRPSIEEWLDWGKETKEITPEVLNFISSQPGCLEDSVPNADATQVHPSRRSWHRLCQSLKAPQNEDIVKTMKSIDKADSESSIVFTSLCTGFVGTEATNMFLDYLKDSCKFLSAENVLKEFDMYDDKLRELKIEDHMNLIQKIEEYFKVPHEPISPIELTNLSKYLDVIPKELIVTLVGKLSSAVEQSDFEERRKIVEMAAPRIIDVLKSH